MSNEKDELLTSQQMFAAEFALGLLEEQNGESVVETRVVHERVSALVLEGEGRVVVELHVARGARGAHEVRLEVVEVVGHLLADDVKVDDHEGRLVARAERVPLHEGNLEDLCEENG